MLTAITKLAVKFYTDKKYLFLFLWIGVFTIYLPSYQGGFFSDYSGFLAEHQRLSFVEFLNLNPSSLYQGVNLVHYIFISLFGTNPIPYYLIFISLHALNGCLAFQFFRRFFLTLGWQANNLKIPLLLGICIWVFSPLMVEVVVWKACIHYLITVAMMLFMLNWLIQYFETKHRKYIWGILVLYYCSTFFLEYFYLIPIYILAISLSLFLGKKIQRSVFVKSIWFILIPSVLIWLLYYVTLYLNSGQLVARVSAETIDYSVLGTVTKLNKYVIHIYLMEYLLPSSMRSTLYSFAETNLAVIILFAASLAIIVYGLITFPRLSAVKKSIIVLFVLAFCSCSAMLPMWFYDRFQFEGDRYYYLPSLFFYMLLSILLTAGGRKVKARIILGLIYLLTHIFATVYLVINVRNASIIFSKIAADYRWHDKEKVLLLNLPIFYKGVPILSAEEESNFANHLNLFNPKKNQAKTYDVLAYNMVGRYDGAHVTVLDSVTIKVSLSQPGSWWWYKQFGAADYANEMYTLTMVENGTNYLLRLKEKPSAGTVLLYLVGGDNWKEVDMTKINVEQW